MPFKPLRNLGLLILTMLLMGVVTLLPIKAQVPTSVLPVADRVNAYLVAGQIEAGANELAVELFVDSDNDDLRFGVGFLQFAQAVENLGQSWYDYGLRSEDGIAEFIPFLRLPVPVNPTPRSLNQNQWRQVLDQFGRELLTAEETLAAINSDTVKLGVYPGRAYLDFDSNGQPSETESLWRIYAQLNRQADLTEAQATNFLVNLDAGDAQWLRGYCHLLAGMLDFYLAHDDSRLFEHVAHLFFQNPVTPYPFLLEGSPELWDDGFFLDLFAMGQLLDLPVTNPLRMTTALEHFQQVTALSRQTWDLYSQETDDDREWIPNPNQTGVIPGIAVTPDMIDQWRAFLDEADAILAGNLLLPFWRGTTPVGINLNRVFTEPQAFNPSLWVQGTAAAPYLEVGTITDPDFWWRLMDAFNGRFLFFALWFN